MFRQLSWRLRFSIGFATFCCDAEQKCDTCSLSGAWNEKLLYVIRVDAIAPNSRVNDKSNSNTKAPPNIPTKSSTHSLLFCLVSPCRGRRECQLNMHIAHKTIEMKRFNLINEPFPCSSLLINKNSVFNRIFYALKKTKSNRYLWKGTDEWRWKF